MKRVNGSHAYTTRADIIPGWGANEGSPRSGRSIAADRVPDALPLGLPYATPLSANSKVALRFWSPIAGSIFAVKGASSGLRPGRATLILEVSAVRNKLVPNQKHKLTGYGRGAWAVAVAGLVTMLVAGCGAASGSAASAGSSSSSFSAYLSCLKQHGVSVPSPSASPGGGFGGFGNFGGSGSSSNSSAFQKARQACASLRPSFGSGGFPGGGFSGFASAIKAFRTCMSDHGEPIPTTRPTSPPAAGSDPADRFLNGLNPGNSKVAAALKACESKLPSFANG